MNSNCSYSPETPNLGQIRRFLEPRDLENWRMTFKNNRAPLLCYFKLCAAFRSHWWIQVGVTVRKHPIWVKFHDFLEPCDLEIGRMTSKNNRAPLLNITKLYVSFHHHMWIQSVSYSPETVKLGCDLCDLDLWPLTSTFCMDKLSYKARQLKHQNKIIDTWVINSKVMIKDRRNRIHNVKCQDDLDMFGNWKIFQGIKSD